MVWEKVKDEKDDVQFWNQKDGKPSLVVEVWNCDKNLWRASVNNSWLAKFIIAYEGEQWSKSNVDEFDLDYARLTGWLRGLARRHIK